MMDVFGYMEAVGWEILEWIRGECEKRSGLSVGYKKREKRENKHLGPFTET